MQLTAQRFNMKARYYIPFVIFISLVLGMMHNVSADTLSMSPVKTGDVAILKQTCGTCSYVNVSVYYPNGSTAVDNVGMNSDGGGRWTYPFSDTTQLGRYDYPTCGDIEGVHKCSTSDGVPYFEVTPSGNIFDNSKSLPLFGSLIVMIIISLIFLYIAVKSENVVSKISFYTFSVIGFVMIILYTVITIQQVLFGFESIITGIETFWFVAKIGIGIGVLAFAIIIFLVMLKAWKIKRGLKDID